MRADAIEVPFGKIAETMASRTCQDADASPMRALVATMVAVGPPDRLRGAAAPLQALADAGTVRGMFISEGDNPAPPARVAGNTVALHGLQPRYINNAVGALRLSSLPMIVWWRGGRPDTLDGLADLADRVVLDEAEPDAIWTRAAGLFERSAFSDLRWARLTQWRAAMAQLFDMPEVQEASTAFTELSIRGGDRMSALLYAAWLTSSGTFTDDLAAEIADAAADVPIEEIRLGGRRQELVLRLTGNGCLETSVSVGSHRDVSSVAPLRAQSETVFLTEELSIRARDIAFERTVQVLIDRRMLVNPLEPGVLGRKS